MIKLIKKEPPKNRGVRKARAQEYRNKFRDQILHYDLDTMSNTQVINRCRHLGGD